jgi:hypothetical protein
LLPVPDRLPLVGRYEQITAPKRLRNWLGTRLTLTA